MPEIFKKFKDILLGVDIEDDDDYDEYDDYDDYEDDYDEPPRRKPEIQKFSPSSRGTERGTAARGTAYAPPAPPLRPMPGAGSSNVVDIHRSKTQVYVHGPKNIEDARDVIENTKSDIISVVNLEGVDGATAQRIADFLSGSVDALDATIRRLSYDMFIIAPRGVEITGDVTAEINEELKSSGISLPWLNSAFK